MIGSGKGILIARLCVVVAVAALGCTKNENFGCPGVDAQGGPVIGTWNVAPNGACMAADDSVATSDWCSQLVYDANGVRLALLGHPMVPFKAGSIEFDGGGHYTSQLSFETLPQAPGRTHFAASCLTAYGSQPTCESLAEGLGMFLSDNGAALLSYRLLPSLMYLPFYPVGLTPQPSYSNFNCQDDGASGCNCTYTVGLVVPDKGAWNADKTTVLSMFSDTDALPYDNDFVADGTGLAMVGHDGLDLLGQAGLRTLIFSK